MGVVYENIAIFPGKQLEIHDHISFQSKLLSSLISSFKCWAEGLALPYDLNALHFHYRKQAFQEEAGRTIGSICIFHSETSIVSHVFLMKF